MMSDGIQPSEGAKIKETPKDDAQPAPWNALWVLALGLAMIVLDSSIVNVAMPTMIREIHIDLTDAQWVTSLYNIVLAALLLPFGKLGDIRGRKTTLQVGVVIFVSGSIAAACSHGVVLLLAARAVQAVGGALVMPSTLSTVSASFRGKNRAIAFGVWGSVMSAAAAVGPLLGGLFTSTIGWRWIFLVNLPLGLIVFIGAIFFVPQTGGVARRPAPAGTAAVAAGGTGGDAQEGTSKQRFADPAGVALSALGAAFLIFGLIEGETYGWWKPVGKFSIGGFEWGQSWPVSVIPICIVLGVLFFALFIHTENGRAAKGKPVMLDLTLFRIPTFSLGNIAACAIAAGQFAVIFVLPLYLINARGLGMMATGALVASMGLGSIVSGALARAFTKKLGAAGTVQLGLVLETLGVAGTLVLMNPGVPVLAMLVSMLLYGFGLGLASAQLTSLVLSGVPVAQSGEGSATQSMVRQLGTGVGSAVAGAVLAIAIGRIVPAKLVAISGLPAGAVIGLTASLSDSAGSVIPGIAAQGTHGRLGSLGPQVVEELRSGFIEAGQWTLVSSIVMLLIGLLASVWIARAVKRGAER